MNLTTERPAVSDPLDPTLRASLWLEQVAHALFECEKAENPQRNLPSWDQVNQHMRADARYRAMGAHQRSNATVKAVLVERIAQVLALADGFIWPTCDSPIRPVGMPPAQYAAQVAARRQLYRHKARLVITATFSYLDVNAAGEPEESREAVLARAKAQQVDDVLAAQHWRQVKTMPSCQWSRIEAFPVDARD